MIENPERGRRAHTSAIAAVFAVSALGAMNNTLAFERVEIPSGNDAATNAAPDRTKPLTPSKAMGGLNALYSEYQAHRAARSSAPFESQSTTSRVTPDGRVAIDAVASGDVEQLRADLESLSAEIIAVAGRMISALLPIDQIPSLDGLDSLAFAQPAASATSTGSVTSQGDAAMAADAARTNFTVTGSGSTVGILSDSFNCPTAPGSYAADVSSGDLPNNVNVIRDYLIAGCTDEGRAMAQIVYDVAPGASLSFHTAEGGQAAFAAGITALANAGADVIVDDVIYFAEPMFQDGVIAQAVDAAKARGVAFFSAAGNSGRQGYEAAFNPCDKCGSAGGGAHDFDPNPGVIDTRLKVRQTSAQATYVLEWSDPYFSVSGPPGAQTDLDICFYAPPNSGTPFFCDAADNLGLDPVAGATLGLPLGASAQVVGIGVERAAGVDPARIKLVIHGVVDFQDNYGGTKASTIYGHANAAGAEAVGAANYDLTPAFGEDPPLLSYYSAAGNTQILFDIAGKPTNQIRGKPEITGPDGVDNTFFGTDTDTSGFPNFFGTSAAAPHAAAVAALMRDFDPTIDPETIKRVLQRNAIDIVERKPRLRIDPIIPIGVGCDRDSGAGLIDANLALGELQLNPPAADLPGTWRASALPPSFFLDVLGNYRWDNCGVVGRFGIPTDIPIKGDWDGDGDDQIGVWRPSNQTFYLDFNGNFRWDPGVDKSGKFGVSTDIPLTGDWNGDGKDTVGVWRPSNRTFYLDFNGNYLWDLGVDRSGVFGVSTDKPVAGDWDGDGTDQIGVWRPSNTTFYLDFNNNYAWDIGVDKSGVFGVSTDVPLAGSWDGGPADKIGVWRASVHSFYFDVNGNYAWDKGTDITADFGLSVDKPVVGRW